MAQVKLRKGESVERMIRRFIKMVKKEGIIEEYKSKRYHKSNREKKKEKMEKSERRRRSEARKAQRALEKRNKAFKKRR